MSEKKLPIALTTKVLLVIVPIVVLFVGMIAVLANMGNSRVPAGFSGYNYTNPIFGKNEYVAVLHGPNSTGFVWRQKVVNVSITPYTMREEFFGPASILGKDKLLITCKTSIVFRIDPEKVKSFMENYGGLAQSSSRLGSNPDDSADELMRYAYDNFVKEPFRTSVRTEISKYAALDASSNLQKISDEVLVQLRQRLTNTPYVVDSVAVGETAPPQEVVQAITRKITASQENERKAIEVEIAKKDIEVQRAQGMAEGSKQLEIAKQVAQAELAKGEANGKVILILAEAEAKGITLKNAAMGPNFLQYTMYNNMLNNAKVYLPSGAKGNEGGFPFFGLLNLNESNKEAK